MNGVDSPRVEQDALRQGGLAAVNMRGYADVACVSQLLRRAP
jgi:hypothetical protein